MREPNLQPHWCGRCLHSECYGECAEIDWCARCDEARDDEFTF
nr:MAG TPA: hypothetical protein [Caudoviricetes sp.]